jgi:hypothetical protein
MVMIVGGFDEGGAPLGGGSPFHVVRAIAVGGQVVRVVFSDEPKHRSASGLDDGRNPANYTVAISVGEGDPLFCVGVLPDVIAFPAFGVMLPTEFALDVQTDRPFVIGMTYVVTAKPALISAVGDLVGYPYSASFVGAVRPVRTRQIRRRTGLVDLETDPFQLGIIVSPAGDWAAHEGLPTTRKRCLRRAFTRKDSFACLPSYGLGADFKTPATANMLGALRTDLSQGIRQEPDVEKAQTSVAMDARGFLALTIKAQTPEGQDLLVTAQATQNGGVTP